MLKSKRTLLALAATLAVAAGGTWGAVAMAASNPGSTTPKSQTPKSQTVPRSSTHGSGTHNGNCPHMGSSSGTSSTMYTPSDV